MIAKIVGNSKGSDFLGLKTGEEILRFKEVLSRRR
jgi:hypothetical protein